MEQYTNPRIWGPHFWFILRCIVNNYPMSPNAQDKEHMESYFYELQYVLPCEKCKYTFKQHFNKYPICKYLTSRHKLVEWLELIFDETNRSIANNRVKILDEYIDTGEMMPIKQVSKNDSDKILEQNLKAEIKKAASNSVNANVTTLAMFAERPVDVKPKLAYEPIKHNVTVDNPIFDKQVNGKKLPTPKTNRDTNQNTIPNLALILNANKNLVPNLQSQKVEIPNTKPIITLTQNDKLAMQKQVFNQIVPQTQSKLISPTPIHQSTTQVPTQIKSVVPPPKSNIPIQSYKSAA